MRNMRKFKALLSALEGVCTGISEEVEVVDIRYSRNRSCEFEVSVHVTHEGFETGNLPVEHLQYRPGGNYPWRMECTIGNTTVMALCTDKDICKIPIDNRTAISPETARYLGFLVAEKEREVKEAESHGVASG